MYVCVCVCVCVCVYIYIYIYTHTHTYTCTYNIYIHTYTCIYINNAHCKRLRPRRWQGCGVICLATYQGDMAKKPRHTDDHSTDRGHRDQIAGRPNRGATCGCEQVPCMRTPSEHSAGSPAQKTADTPEPCHQRRARLLFKGSFDWSVAQS